MDDGPVPDDGPTLKLEDQNARGARTRFGRYEVLERIGEGGMGTVFLAEQVDPVRRRVALKIIRLGMDTDNVVARFESERQALALMNHPNIAQVFDAGANDDGRPFFVMEYVRGTPITDHCDENRLTLEDRLALFVEICQGVQHAHHKGIIHRDIKPSNVLVADKDGRPVAKIIDFGLAKATSGGRSEGDHATEYGTVVGTPDYMSPEQAVGSSLDIDSRTDVYSLGVLLYELLTGLLPHDRGEGPKNVLESLQHLTSEVEPPKPSDRLSTCGERGLQSALTRGTDPSTLSRRLKGDLDWIVMKAMQRDRVRRYQTPSELAADIGRHLGDEPVLAGPPSAGYRLGKFVRRHRKTAAAVLVAIAALTLGTVGTTIGMIQADRARREAERQRRLTQVEADKAGALSGFLVDALASPDPEKQGREVLVYEVLDQAAAGIGGRFDRQPEVEGAVRSALAESYRGLGLYDAAEIQLVETRRLLSSSLGPDHPDTLKATTELASVKGDLGRLDDAQALFRESLEARRSVLGPQHPATLQTANDLGSLLLGMGELDEAEQLFREVLAAAGRTSNEERAEIAITQNNLAYLLQLQGRLDEAEGQYLEALAGLEATKGELHPKALDTLGNLGTLYREMGRLEEAEATLRRALVLRREVLGTDHPSILHSTNNLASVLHSLGELDDAEPLYREALAGNLRVFGTHHPETLTAMNNLATLHEDRGEVAEAESLYRAVIDRRVEVLGDDHQDTLISKHNLAAFLLGAGDLVEAELWSRAAVNGARRTLPSGHFLTAIFEGRLGEILLARGRYPEAEELLLGSHSALVEAYGEDHPRVASTEERLAELYKRWQRSPALRKQPAAGD
mgnify:CR=1 FL=1